ncbi:prolipoprotein diacylglyceryl transferase 2 [Frondihabitans sucicola]|uniref:Phosphatidylglycerol--prolipoprotein diacylglyceryl transferase n=1 Tax=Frondihabitans sucicola TaxID=1268041 RepID=A0ABN6Y3G6_9MICO|nr:prolipoprotein diacylglyceryl transferase 2 [Frondihabitans sucicola]
MLPLSIPSPSASWQFFDFTGWLDSAFGISLPFTLKIHAYAVCILLGIVAAVLVTNARLNRRGAERWVIIDLAIWCVPFGIVGGRFFHVVSHPDDYFGAGKNILTVFYVWEGGLAIFGALAFGAIGAILGCWQTGIRLSVFVDALAPGLMLAQAFGRLGNYFNHELFGTPTTLPWGLKIESTNAAYPVGLPAGTLFHPTFAYEILWNLFGMAVILLINRNVKLEWGKTFALYLLWYGTGRMWFESIRTDYSELFLGVRVNVWVAFLAVGLGVFIFYVQSRRHTGLVPSAYVPGKGPNEAGFAPVITGEVDHPEVDSIAESADEDDDHSAVGATAKTTA